MEVPAKVRVVFRQIEQFGVKFHFPPYRSPHWPPNNGFQNLAPISLFSEQNCSQFFFNFPILKARPCLHCSSSFSYLDVQSSALIAGHFFFQIQILIQKLSWGYFRKVWNLTYGRLAAKDLVPCSSSIVVRVDLSPLHGWAIILQVLVEFVWFNCLSDRGGWIVSDDQFVKGVEHWS